MSGQKWELSIPHFWLDMILSMPKIKMRICMTVSDTEIRIDGQDEATAENVSCFYLDFPFSEIRCNVIKKMVPPETKDTVISA